MTLVFHTTYLLKEGKAQVKRKKERRKRKKDKTGDTEKKGARKEQRNETLKHRM
jgi:hypothetical protein